MKNTRGLLTAMTVLLIATVIIAAIPTENEGAIYGDTVRLHIPANSDNEEDQAVKLEVRDMLLREYGTELSTLGSKEDAEDKLSCLLPDIKASADKILIDKGMQYRSDAELVTEWYDTRSYGELTLPAGYYTSLKVTLGEGSGRNWWCVMFPPMCLGMATESTDGEPIQYTEEEYRLIREGGYSIKFKILELISEACREVAKNR